MLVERKNNKIHFNYFNRAYVIISIDKEENFVSIDILRVEPHFRGMGVASKIIEEVLNYIRSFFSRFKKVILSPLPLEHNGIKLTQLINFYKKFGFRLTRSDDLSKPYLMTMFL